MNPTKSPRPTQEPAVPSKPLEPAWMSAPEGVTYEVSERDDAADVLLVMDDLIRETARHLRSWKGYPTTDITKDIRTLHGVVKTYRDLLSSRLA